MELRQLTPRYYVSPQISPSDMDALRDAGITLILCNRPDEEVPQSHCAQSICAAAEAAGLKFAERPLSHQTMVPPVIEENKMLGADTDDVVLAYCASGTRSCIAWALGQAGTLDADTICEAASKQGYDLSNISHVLDRPFR